MRCAWPENRANGRREPAGTSPDGCWLVPYQPAYAGRSPGAGRRPRDRRNDLVYRTDRILFLSFRRRSAGGRSMRSVMATQEHARLDEIHDDAFGWRRWGPYLSDRAWAP